MWGRDNEQPSMTEGDSLSVGDEWPYHYRGFSLQASPNGDVWWQLYQGTDRLVLEPAPEEIVERLLEHKRIGGRMHITEQGDVLTRVEGDDDEYDQIYLGTVEGLDGELVPQDAPEYSIDLRPTGLEPGDLWPSVYDGSRYSFAGERVWWHSGQSHKRHPAPDGLPEGIQRDLRRYKPDGGSFRVLPWGDVITLVSLHPTPDKVGEQFGDLPRVVRNIIKLRKSRDVEMLPVYIGSLDGYEIKVNEPTSLADSLSEKEQEELASWAENLGRTSNRSSSTHRASRDSGQSTDRADPASGSQQTGGTADASSDSSPDSKREAEDSIDPDAPGPSDPDSSVNSTSEASKAPGEDSHEDDDEDDGPRFDDDPLEWMREDMDGERDEPGDDRDRI